MVDVSCVDFKKAIIESLSVSAWFGCLVLVRRTPQAFQWTRVPSMRGGKLMLMALIRLLFCLILFSGFVKRRERLKEPRMKRWCCPLRLAGAPALSALGIPAPGRNSKFA